MRPLRLALAKGRLASAVEPVLAAAGFRLPPLAASRALSVQDRDGRLCVVLVKSEDIPVYVERGAVDVGVVGNDVLVEAGSRLPELLDLELGRARMCVAGRGPWASSGRRLVVASKYPRTARRHFGDQGIPTDVVTLNGSVELAPLLGLADLIVDIVETGTTLAENDLRVLETVFPVSARAVANPVSLRSRHPDVAALVAALQPTATQGEVA